MHKVKCKQYYHNYVSIKINMLTVKRLTCFASGGFPLFFFFVLLFFPRQENKLDMAQMYGCIQLVHGNNQS